MTVLGIVNAVVAAVSVLFGLAAAARPGLLSGSEQPGDGERFYAWMYAIRAVPFGVAAAVLPLTSPGAPVAVLLLAAAVAQFADAGIGARRGEKGMIAGGTVVGLVHLVTAFVVF